MVINSNKVVTLSYQLFSIEKNHEPVLIEERGVDNPLEFIYGQDVLLPMVEEKIKGQSRGFSAQIELHPKDAFGLHREDLQIWMSKDRFPKKPELQLGMKFQTQGPNGDLISVIVKEIQEDKILIDGNHPLAGLFLRFDLKVLRVREASPEELTAKNVNPAKLH